MANYNFELIEPHQTQFVNSKARYLLNSGGVGSGKTIALILRTLKLILEYPGIFILVGGQTYPFIRDTILRDFVNMVPPELIKDYNKTNQTFKFINKSEVIFRSLDDSSKFKSLNLGAVCIEELTDTTEDVFKMLRTRLRQPNIPCTLYAATNPSSFEHWVHRVFLEGQLKNCEIIYSKSNDNFFLPQEYLEDLESIKETNPEYYKRMVLGMWGKLEGLIYNFPYDQRLEMAEIPSIDQFSRSIAGLDFGYKSPTGFVAIRYRGMQRYILDEFYKRELSSANIIENVKELDKKYNFEAIYCDSARPEIIQDMVDAGLPAVSATKHVFDGLMFVKSLIGSKLLSVSKNCHYTLREFDSYIWDKKSIKEIPLKVNDHLMDAVRYAVYSDARKYKQEEGISPVSSTRKSKWGIR